MDANGVLYVPGEATLDEPAKLYAVAYQPLFNADYNTDTDGFPPSLSPPGDPAGDSAAMVNEAAASGDFIRVQNSPEFPDRSVRIHRQAARYGIGPYVLQG